MNINAKNSPALPQCHQQFKKKRDVPVVVLARPTTIQLVSVAKKTIPASTTHFRFVTFVTTGDREGNLRNCPSSRKGPERATASPRLFIKGFRLEAAALDTKGGVVATCVHMSHALPTGIQIPPSSSAMALTSSPPLCRRNPPMATSAA
jgi:hypothetical protein